MRLDDRWDYILQVSKDRLSKNKTKFHVQNVGKYKDIEIMGAAGEIVARRTLGLRPVLHTGYDGGIDLQYAGYTIDVKTTKMTPAFQHRYLQWRADKVVRAEIVVLTAVNIIEKTGMVIGWVPGEAVMRAPVNNDRAIPCHEISVQHLEPLWKLMSEAMRVQ